MRPLIVSGILFAISLALHAIIWKIRMPKRQLRTLALIFTFVFGSWLVCAWPSLSAFDAARIALVFVPASLCYLVTYSAIEADSPTLSLMRFIAQAGTAGRTSDEVKNFFSQRPFITVRLAALTQSGIVQIQNGKYVVTRNGSLAFRLVLNFRKLYGPLSRNG